MAESRYGRIRICLLMCFTVAAIVVRGQEGPVPFSEARKAMNHIEGKKRVYDSLRMQYSGRWTLGFTYGQRFISNQNKTESPDNITFTDFTKRRSFYGLNFGYFINSFIHIAAGAEFMVLPQEKQISSISFASGGVTARGRGNGGVLLEMSIASRFYYSTNTFFRPYGAVKVGVINMAAKGFSGLIDLSAEDEVLNERNSSFRNLAFLLGGSYRSTPSLLLDFNIGYSFANGGEPIGGVKSPGGITTSLTLQFILNPNKN